MVRNIKSFLKGVLETAALEVRHRVDFAPDDIVEDPEVQILQHGADAEDVVIGADHPDGAGRLSTRRQASSQARVKAS